jgi:hypothetical protein
MQCRLCLGLMLAALAAACQPRGQEYANEYSATRGAGPCAHSLVLHSCHDDGQPRAFEPGGAQGSAVLAISCQQSGGNVLGDPRAD